MAWKWLMALALVFALGFGFGLVASGATGYEYRVFGGGRVNDDETFFRMVEVDGWEPLFSDGPIIVRRPRLRIGY